MINEELHGLAREKGVSRALYATVRVVVTPFFRTWFRLGATGVEHVPREGAAIVAPNHKSFWDSFLIAACIPHRPLRYMGKTELFQGRRGRLLIRLGAFPVRRGEADREALETARAILRKGELLALFPEGTRVRDPDRLGHPRRGAGRLALETGAPLVPTAITGTDRLFAGPVPKPKRVRVAFAEPIDVRALAASQEAAAELVEEMLWPEVETQFRALRTRPTLIAAALAALGIGGVVARRRGVGPGRRGRRRSKLRLPGRKSPRSRLRLPGR